MIPVNVLYLLIVSLHGAQGAVEESTLEEHAPRGPKSVDAPRPAHLNRFHDPGDGERRAWENYGVPRSGGIRQKDPSRQQESVLLPALPHRVGENPEFRLVQFPPQTMNPAGDKEISVRKKVPQRFTNRNSPLPADPNLIRCVPREKPQIRQPTDGLMRYKCVVRTFFKS